MTRPTIASRFPLVASLIGLVAVLAACSSSPTGPVAQGRQVLRSVDSTLVTDSTGRSGYVVIH
ncbi:MAG: hypothetical protein JWO05_166 [Gemmatimonadetes bacterium]|nr:hypothetical protein [Gemmatimonadota bacterium]